MTGETALDLGCGAGFDALLAARDVGPTGLVIGVDMTSSMVAKARQNAVKAGRHGCGQTDRTCAPRDWRDI